MTISIPALLVLSLCPGVACVVGLFGKLPNDISFILANKASILPTRDFWVDCFWSDRSLGSFSLAEANKCIIIYQTALVKYPVAYVLGFYSYINIQLNL